MQFYVTKFDDNGDPEEPIKASVNKLIFGCIGNKFIATLDNGTSYSYPIVPPLSEIDYPGMKQEGYNLTNVNVLLHIQFLNQLMKTKPEAFDIISLVVSNSNIRKSLRVDICFKNDYLSQIELPNFPNPIK